MKKDIVEKVLNKIFSSGAFIHEIYSTYKIEQDGYFFTVRVDFYDTSIVIGAIKDNEICMYEDTYFTFKGPVITLYTKEYNEIVIKTDLSVGWHESMLSYLTSNFGKILKHCDKLYSRIPAEGLCTSCYLLDKIKAELKIEIEDYDDKAHICIRIWDEGDYINLYALNLEL